MGAQLRSTVYVTDPETHQTVRLEPGTLPEPRLAALVTNPAAWVDGKLPRLPKKQDAGQGPTGGGQDDASGAASASTGADGTSAEDADSQAAPAAKKTAARKTAATKPARGRDAADEGTSGD
jgi:hypothetical protein